MAVPMSPVFYEVAAERQYQDSKWGHETDDTLNTPWMWASYISQYATKWMAGTFQPIGSSTTDAFRKAMIKTAAISIAGTVPPLSDRK